MPNPWGVAFDDYGQGTVTYSTVSWLTPASVKPIYGYNMLAPDSDKFRRPTSGLEIVSTPTFPRTFKATAFQQHNRFWEQNNISWWRGSALPPIGARICFLLTFEFQPVDLEFAPMDRFT